jgi:hypothetical protein
MPVQYAVITQQGHRFTVVLVQKAILNDPTTAARAIDWLQTQRFHMPTVLMARDERGSPNAYYGRNDLALLLSRVLLTALPWQETAI